MKPKTVERENGHRLAARRSMAHSGLIQGAQILTMDGELPVEFLQPGDRVITRDVGMARLKAVVTRRIRIRPVLLNPGTLGQSRPPRNVMMLPGQPVLLRDWRAIPFSTEGQALVPLAQLVDGELILQSQVRMSLRVFELQFDEAHIIYADGVETASGMCRMRAPNRARLAA